MDRAPVLALTGQINTQVMGPGAFQEIDLASAFEAVARFSQTVLPNSSHAELASLALKTAIVEREKRGGITAATRRTVDGLLDRLQNEQRPDEAAQKSKGSDETS